ncbi:hypothetical protein P7C70_g8908, partial [Phenoliferia sp. Uapishka_3]
MAEARAPPPPPTIPAFSMADDEPEPQRGEDSYDLLSGWARSLSVSPRLYPTYGNSSANSMHMGLEGGSMSSTFGSYRGLGDASPVLGPSNGPRKQSLTVGTGLSPVLGPTHMNAGSNWGGLGGIGSGSSAMLMASGQGTAFDYSSFGQYHSNSPSGDHLQIPHSPQSHELGRQISNPGVAQSYSNIDEDRSMSPQDLPPPLNTHSPLPPASPILHSPINGTPKSEQDALPAMEHSIDPPADEDPRIRAYAKLEFPTFDIYIQKLSVIVGRRPAPAKEAVPAPAPRVSSVQPPTPSDSKREESESHANGVKLEDFVNGMGEEARREGQLLQVKVEQPLEGLIMEVKQEDVAFPQPSLAPDSGSGSPVGAAPFSEFIRSSPPPSVIQPSNSSADAYNAASNPPLTADALATAAETRDLLDMLTLAVAEGNQSQHFDNQTPVQAPSEPASAPEAASIAESASGFAPLPPPRQILTDIDLGPIRAVSRQHARLYFDYELGQWAIEVLGRNGVVVEGKWKAKGEREGLGKRTKIQIAERIFYFVLPTIDTPAQASDPNDISTVSGNLEEHDSSSDDDHDDDGESSSLSEMSDSAIELSPLLNPVILPQPPVPTLTDSTPALPPLPPLSPRKAEKKARASVSAKATTSASTVASASTNPLALAPPARQAARNINYSGGATAGKRLEVLQAVRSAKSGGLGKGAGKMAGGRGKGKMG